MKYLKIILFVLILSLVYVLVTNTSWSFMGKVFLMLLLSLFFSWILNSDRAAKQAERDWKANQISETLDVDREFHQLSAEDEAIEKELEEWITDDASPIEYLRCVLNRDVLSEKFNTTLPLALFIRPFAFDGELIVPNPEISKLAVLSIPFYKMISVESINWEEILTLGVGNQMDFVSIGRPNDIIGAGKIQTSDAEWRNEFMRLANSARLIFSIPAIYESTLWELKWLARHQMQGKTIMIFTKLHSDEVANFGLESLTRKIREFGWHLPINVSTSSIVIFNRNGKIKEHYENASFNKFTIEKVVKTFLATES